MADDPAMEAAKKELAKTNEVKTKLIAETTARLNARPTPTQEESDLVALGVAVPNKEDDGSGPEPRFVITRTLEPAPATGSQSYATRSTHRAAHSSSSS
jgi:hypothetical protein